MTQGRPHNPLYSQTLFQYLPSPAVTRDPTKSFAQALSKLGAQVVSADYRAPGSIKAALSGAHAVFAIINFWAILT
ncbi:hypothetical protein SBOR_3050 [Sclerotinia borealis F-4128]|uniref:NmrA-like domain-containing protein n=1 Tax=Sclerotinia borealis (strain F-4128) TaxID=1432307 RepID=W9CKL8_SCLBF|nr:hypothetical protein SBOR_3050 [Sclerotinia borealis F-4128]